MNISIELPLISELFTTMRLSTGGICSLAGVDLDRSEDCKVCVTESLLLLTHAGFSSARIDFDVEDGLLISVRGRGERTAARTLPEDDISAALLSALAEKVRFVRRKGDVVTVKIWF